MKGGLKSAHTQNDNLVENTTTQTATARLYSMIEEDTIKLMNEIIRSQRIQNKTDIICCHIRYYVIISFVLFLIKSCDLLLNACLWRRSVLHAQKKNSQTANVISKQLIEKQWILTTPETSDISGYNGVSDGWNCILDLSLEDQTESHFHAPSAGLGLGHATAAGHDNSPATACLHPHLCLHPSQDPYAHDDPGT